jgi:hypothetical protein
MTVKVAIVDVITREYYIGDKNEFTPIFGHDIAKAKLYVVRPELLNTIEYVKQCSNRDLNLVDVKITHALIGDSDYAGNYYAKFQKKATKNLRRAGYCSIC